MQIKIGCDLVNIERFKKSLENGGNLFLEKIFSPEELKNRNKIESLAGLFAAKEATFKALDITTDNWLNIRILKQKSGKPYLILDSIDLNFEYSCDISISHDGIYALAFVTFLIRE
ncbi:hypothetical protein A3F66_06875 [candidate division TM6 bacterium RIFCSPHIGHO2_12_FULL_32_22]|nr:MAG: hypothetical protein A3F66_06875 [candidate division TM6 bacterium RIFCSPHIGHO2_12_FULL_32_22]